MSEFARSGPGFAQIERYGPVDWAGWRTAADQMEEALDDGPDRVRRIHHFYLPVLFFCMARCRAAARRPIVVGLQAPQGAGKTTLASHLLSGLSLFDLRGVSVSIDDFYLTRDEQLDLASAHDGNPYFEHRGYPGTHDMGLGERTIGALHQIGGAGSGSVRVPVYDKSAHGGRGDRAPESAWRTVSGPLDLVLVEGWMLGFTPVDEASLTDPALVAPNRALADYDRWYRLLDEMIVLRPTDPTHVLTWRVEAEEHMKARGLPGLDRAAIEDYVRRFLPAYRTYGGAPPRFDSADVFELWLDRERRPVPSATISGP